MALSLVGLRAPGLRAKDDPLTTVALDGSWGTSLARRLIDLAEIPENEAGVEWERFTAPDTTSFGERWVRTAGAGGTVTHDANLRGGVASLTAAAATFLENSLLWSGPPLVLGTAVEAWGIAFRCLITAAPVNNAAVRLWMGLADQSVFTCSSLFGISGGVDAVNFCTMQNSGTAAAVSTYSIANLCNNTEREVILYQKAVAGVRTVFYQVDGVYVGSQTIVGTNTNRKPFIFNNAAVTLKVDDMLMVYRKAFAS